jgi:hypothetical protein
VTWTDVVTGETHRVFGSRRTAVYNKGQRIGENGEKGKNGLLDFSNLEGLDGTSEFLSQYKELLFLVIQDKENLKVSVKHSN